MGSKTNDSFHVQLASIIEVLANTAVAEICKLVDDGYAMLHLEISQNQREIDNLRRKLLLAKLQSSRRNHAAERPCAPRRASPRVSVRSRHVNAAEGRRATRSAADDVADDPVVVKVEGRAQDPVGPSTHTPAPPGSAVSGPACGSPPAAPDRTPISRDPACYWESYPGPPVSLGDSTVTPATGGDGEGWAGAACGDLGNVVSGLAVGGRWGAEPVPVKEEVEGRGAWLSGEEEEEEEEEGGGGEEGGVDAVGANGSSPFRTCDSEGGGRSKFSSVNFKTSSSFIGRSSSFSHGHQHLLPPSSSSSCPGRAPLLPGGGPLFRCDVCGKSFTKSPSLRRHERVHTGEKPFACRHCAKRFSHSHQLKNHERVHTGEKPFRCHVCGRCFAQSNHMKRHLRTHGPPDGIQTTDPRRR